MTIQLLGFGGCPNTPVMRENLHAALKSIGSGLTCQDVDQETLPESDVRRGWPAPTVLVDGKDLFGMAQPSTAPITCRVYAGGVPDAAEIAVRLQTLRPK